MESLKPYVVLIVAWSIYLFLHSALATTRVKTLVDSRMSPRAYRLFYSILSTIGLLALLFLNGITPGGYLLVKSKGLQTLGIIFAAGGIFVLRAAFKQYSMSDFLGLSKTDHLPRLNRQGILGKVRHPIYSATILITLGFLLFDPRIPTLVSMGCVWIYLPIGIFFEEKKLIRQFGEEYIQYRKRVPAVIPTILK